MQNVKFVDFGIDQYLNVYVFCVPLSKHTLNFGCIAIVIKKSF